MPASPATATAALRGRGAAGGAEDLAEGLAAVSIDCGAVLDGYAWDTAFSFYVGTADAEAVRLMDATREALQRGIGWAAVTADGGRAAHVEHSVAVTVDGPVIRTLP